MGFQPEKTCEECLSCGICGGKRNAKFCRKFVSILPPPPPPKAKTEVFYLCDRRKCENCSSDCTHTSDIRHAVNFRMNGEVFEEYESADSLSSILEELLNMAKRKGERKCKSLKNELKN